MKKLIITFCLMFLCIALFNSRVYAVFITNITEFKQYNGSLFTDTFGDGDVPITGSEYVVEGSFSTDPNRETDGKLELDSDDGTVYGSDIHIGAAVSNSTYYFNPDTGGQYLEGWFDFGGGLPPDPFSWLGIGISNWAPGFDEPASHDEAKMGVTQGYVDGVLHLFGSWSDESQYDPLGFVDLGEVVSTTIGLRLEIDSSTDEVTALFNYDGGGFNAPSTFVDISPTDFTILNYGLHTGDIYTGGFDAGTEIVPEPTTMALLGIGLAGLGGRYLRKRKIRRPQ